MRAAPAQFSALAIAVATGDTVTVLTKDKQQMKISLMALIVPRKV